MSNSLDMKDLFVALLPDGSIWKPKPDGDFDKLLEGMGANAEEVREFLAALADLRDPQKTILLSDLETEYGIVPDSVVAEQDRRDQLSAIKYAKSGTGSSTYLQDRLQAAGFDLIVTENSPAIDPDIILSGGYRIMCGSPMAYCGYNTGGAVLAVCGIDFGELLVNGDLWTQSIAYEMQCGGANAYAGNAKAIAGYFLKQIRTAIEYIIPSVPDRWNLVFFVGGVPSGWPGSPVIERRDVPNERREMLKTLILKYKPMHSWCVLVVNYV